MSKKPSLDTISDALLASWDEQTCSHKCDWSKDNPAKGQCRTTAVVINHLFGGEILSSPLPNGSSHFWNKIDGKEYDFTKSQFPAGTKFDEINLADYDEIMKDTGVQKAFEILMARINKFYE